MREIAHHLADGELSSAIRLRRLIAEDDPVIVGYDERTFTDRLHSTERPIATSLAAAAAARASTLTILECLTDEEWARTGTHSEMGAYSVERWLQVYANHPWEHAEQVRRRCCARRSGPMAVDTLRGSTPESATPHMTTPLTSSGATSAAPPAALPTRSAGRPTL